jgi:hypothetical protein
MRKAALSAKDKFDLLGLSVVPVSAVAGAGLWSALKRKGFSGPELNRREVLDLARRHLGPNVVVHPIPGLGNASYQKQSLPGGKVVHIIRYDPMASKSVIAHEIGHGMGSIPRVPGSGLLSPFFMIGGAMEAGAAKGMGQRLGKFWPAAGVLGAAAYAPTLADEALASHRGRKILRDTGEGAPGLNTALMTYALPMALAGLAGGGSYALGRKIVGRPVLPFSKGAMAMEKEKELVAARLLVKRALAKAAKPPNYRPSTGPQACANCKYFNGGTCKKYNYPVKADYVCDQWESS